MDEFEAFRARSYSAGVALAGSARRIRTRRAEDQALQRSRSCKSRPVPRPAAVEDSLVDACKLMTSAMSRMSAQDVNDVTVHVASETPSPDDFITVPLSHSDTIAQQQQQLSPKAQRPHDLDLDLMRPRTRSMPSRTQLTRPGSRVTRRVSSHSHRLARQQQQQAVEQQAEEPQIHYHRVRSFSTSSKKGIVNRGDSLKKCTAVGAQPAATSSQVTVERETLAPSSPLVPDAVRRSRACSVTSESSSATSACSACSAAVEGEPPRACRVLVMGSSGVGKTLLIQQFMTSENIDTTDTADGPVNVRWVDVMLDDEQCQLMIEDIGDNEDPLKHGEADSYIVVYSVADRDSFDDAIDVLYALRKADVISKSAVILVANKGDMVRNREVSDEEGKVMATRYDCKFVEVSALLSLNVDELLAGVVRQIQLNGQRLSTAVRQGKGLRRTASTGARVRRESPSSCVREAAMGLVNKLIRHTRADAFNSCDNLLVL